MQARLTLTLTPTLTRTLLDPVQARLTLTLTPTLIRTHTLTLPNPNPNPSPNLGELLSRLRPPPASWSVLRALLLSNYLYAGCGLFAALR